MGKLLFPPRKCCFIILCKTCCALDYVKVTVPGNVYTWSALYTAYKQNPATTSWRQWNIQTDALGHGDIIDQFSAQPWNLSVLLNLLHDMNEPVVKWSKNIMITCGHTHTHTHYHFMFLYIFLVLSNLSDVCYTFYVNTISFPFIIKLKVSILMLILFSLF